MKRACFHKLKSSTFCLNNILELVKKNVAKKNIFIDCMQFYDKKTLKILCSGTLRHLLYFQSALKNNITISNVLHINFLMENFKNIIDALRFWDNPGVEKQENKVIID